MHCCWRFAGGRTCAHPFCSGKGVPQFVQILLGRSSRLVTAPISLSSWLLSHNVRCTRSFRLYDGACAALPLGFIIASEPIFLIFPITKAASQVLGQHQSISVQKYNPGIVRLLKLLVSKLSPLSFSYFSLRLSSALSQRRKNPYDELLFMYRRLFLHTSGIGWDVCGGTSLA